MPENQRKGAQVERSEQANESNIGEVERSDAENITKNKECNRNHEDYWRLR